MKKQQSENNHNQSPAQGDHSELQTMRIVPSTIWHDCVLSVDGDAESTPEALRNFLTTDNQSEVHIDCAKVTPMPDDIRSYYSNLEAYHQHRDDPEWKRSFDNERMRLSDKYDFPGDPGWWTIRNWATSKSEKLRVSVKPYGLCFLAEDHPAYGLVAALAAKVDKPLLLSWYQIEAELCGFFRCDPRGDVTEEANFKIREAPAWLHGALGSPSQLLEFFEWFTSPPDRRIQRPAWLTNNHDETAESHEPLSI